MSCIQNWGKERTYTLLLRKSERKTENKNDEQESNAHTVNSFETIVLLTNTHAETSSQHRNECHQLFMLQSDWKTRWRVSILEQFSLNTHIYIDSEGVREKERHKHSTNQIFKWKTKQQSKKNIWAESSHTFKQKDTHTHTMFLAHIQPSMKASVARNYLPNQFGCVFLFSSFFSRPIQLFLDCIYRR